MNAEPVILRERSWFEARLARSSASASSGCIEWRGATSAAGYGMFRLRRQAFYAHRASFILAKGEIPTGKQVQHLCHNARCLNPEHLVLGSPKENSAAMKAANRQIRGEKHSQAKLGEADVIEIRKQIGVREHLAIAADFGVDPSLISLIKHRKVWGWLNVVDV